MESVDKWRNKMSYSVSVKSMVKISMLGVLSFIVMLIEMPLPFFPPFLKLDMSDLVALVTAFSMGPLAAILVELIKNVIHLLRTSTGGVGEFANFIIGASFVVPAGIIYFKNKSKKNAVLGLIAGTICMALIGALANYYILIPFYSNFMPIDAIIGMARAANPLIVSVKTYALYAVIPFNLIKGIIVSIITLLIYKRISPLLHTFS